MVNKFKNKKGFTLIELLVVIAIIGILAVIAVPALFKSIGKAKVADLTSDYNTIKSAVLSLYSDQDELSTSEVLASTNKLDEYMESKLEVSPIGGVYITVPNKKDEKDKNYMSSYHNVSKYNEKTKKYEKVNLEENFELVIRVANSWGNYKGGNVKITESQFKQLSKNIGSNFVFIYNENSFGNSTSQEVLLGVIPKK